MSNKVIKIMAHNNGESARLLANELSNGKLLNKQGAPISADLVINWGCSRIDRHRYSDAGGVWINAPVFVNTAANKKRFFNSLALSTAGYALPEFYTSKYEALRASQLEGVTLVARTVLNGHGGAGIQVLTPASVLEQGDLPDAELYTQAIEKRREYRVHVGYDRHDVEYKVIDVQRKVRRSGVDDSDRPFIWNHDNDFVFQRGGITPDSMPSNVYQFAKLAVKSLGLHFGAVDVVVAKGKPLMESEVYVLEVNTAPGLAGTTLANYVRYFRCFADNEPFMGWEDHQDTEEETSEVTDE